MSTQEEKAPPFLVHDFVICAAAFVLTLCGLAWFEPFAMSGVDRSVAEQEAWVQSVNEKCEALGGTPLWDRSGSTLMDCAGAVGISEKE